MSDYKVVFREDSQSDNATGIMWEENCPILIEAIQVSRDVQTGEAYLQLKFRNVSSEEVCSLKATAIATFENGEREDVEIVLLDADVEPGKIRKPAPILLKRGDVSEVSVKICALKLPSGDWKSTKETIPVPRPKQARLSDKAQTERSLQWHPKPSDSKMLHKDFALDKEIDDRESWWVCPCGQLNVNREDCLLCNTPKTFWREHPADNDRLEKEADERAEKEAEERALQEAEQKERAKKNKRIRRIVLTTSLIVVAVILAIVAVFQIVRCVVPGAYVVTRCTTTDSKGNKETIEYELDDRGNVVKEIEDGGKSEWTHERNDYGVVTGTPYNDEYYFVVESVDDSGQPTKIKRYLVIESVDDNGQSTKIKAQMEECNIEWFGEGKIRSIEWTSYDDPTCFSSASYNENGELLASDYGHSDHTVDHASYSYEYDSNGRVIADTETTESEYEYQGVPHSYSYDITSKYTYDNHGNVIRAESERGTSVTEWEYTYVMNPSPAAMVKSRCFLGQERLLSPPF